MSHQQKKVPSSLADLGVSGDLLVNKGNIDCSANPNYPAATAGDTYIVSVAGKIGGGSGTDVDIKDMIVCKTTAIAGTQAAVGSSWFVLDGDDDLTLQVLGTLINSATDKATPVDADYVGLMDSAAGNITKKLSWANIKATLKTYFDTIYQIAANKDATGGYAGLTLFKLNLKNAANTFTNFLTNATTAARTWTMPDKDGTVAMLDDIVSGGVLELVQYTTATGTTSITSGALDLSTDKRYIVYFEVSGAQDNCSLRFTINGSGASQYYNGGCGVDSAFSIGGFGSATGAFASITSTTSTGVTGKIEFGLVKNNGTNARPSWTFHTVGTGITGTANQGASAQGGGFNFGETNITSLTLTNGSGNNKDWKLWIIKVKTA